MASLVHSLAYHSLPHALCNPHPGLGPYRELTSHAQQPLAPTLNRTVPTRASKDAGGGSRTHMSLSRQKVLSLPRLSQLRHPGAVDSPSPSLVGSGRLGIIIHTPWRVNDERRRLESPRTNGRTEIKARIGIEPMYSGFADRRLTIWLPRRTPPTRSGLTIGAGLQTAALPFGYAATRPRRCSIASKSCLASCGLRTCPSRRTVPWASSNHARTACSPKGLVLFIC